MRDTIAERVRRSFAEDGEQEGELNPTIGTGFAPPARLLGESEFHWFHPPLQGARYLAVLSGEPVWYAGHYTRGRMRLCEGENCESCLLEIGRQVRYVVCAVDLQSKEVGFLEVGVAGGDVLQRAFKELGSLKGAVLALSRVSRKKNARIELELVHETCPAWAKDIMPLSVQSALHQTWMRAKGKAPMGAHD